MDWQPIETAPKNGTVVLIYRKIEAEYAAEGWAEGSKPGEMLCVWEARWCEPDFSEGYWADPGDMGRVMDDPTHWMPLPSPPSIGERK